MMRCVEAASAALAVLALAGCVSLPSRLSGRAILGGYKLMDAPSSDVPVGARWEQGIGPVGPAAPSSNLVVRRSFSSYSLSRAARRGLEMRAAEFLGIDPGSSATLSATISELSIASVRDTALLSLAPGDAFLSDALKASRITIRTQSDQRASIVASLRARGLDAAAEGSVDGQEILTVEGVDLYFAYRVMRIEISRDGARQIARPLKRPLAPGW